MCRHEIRDLMGTADGIVCRKCGATFASFDELNAASTEPVAEPKAPAEPAEKPKRTRKSAKKEAD